MQIYSTLFYKHKIRFSFIRLYQFYFLDWLRRFTFNSFCI